MAERLATEYVKTYLVLTEAEMLEFIQLFADHQVLLQVKIFENGTQEVVFQDGINEEIALSFERTAGKYICTGSCRLSNPKLVNLMRKSVAEFKGDAIVNRIYNSYTIVYHYKSGAVVRITEQRGDFEKIIYEFKDTLEQLQLLFLKNEVEIEILGIQEQINELLDFRNMNIEMEYRGQIDDRLRLLLQRLFVLEA